MRRITLSLKYSVLAVIILVHCSCVSSAIERSTNKHREILSKGYSREQIRNEVGEPEEAWDKTSHKKPSYDVHGSRAYDVFKVRGVVARPGDGAAQATASAVTFGVGDAISLPFTLASVVTKPFTVQQLVVHYDHNLMYRRHLIFDNKGRKINTFGY